MPHLQAATAGLAVGGLAAPLPPYWVTFGKQRWVDYVKRRRDEGKATSIKYPNYWQGTGPTYTYTFDSMGRPLSLSDGTNTIASGATYGPAGEMTAL